MAELDAPQTDQDLIASANRGDEAAMTALYARHKNWVMGQAKRICPGEEDALDVLQETFVYFFGKFPGFVLTCQLRTFLYPVVRNLALKQKQKRQRLVTGVELPEPAAAPARNLAEEDEAFQHAVAGLPPEQRDVVLLRFGEDQSMQEIAASLNIPVGTVKSRLHNALATLRERIKL